MYLRITSLVIAAFLLVPRILAGQQADLGVNAIDPTVNSRVQDLDHPDNPLLSGGSAAWTGQPMASQPPSAPAQRLRVNQFPSLIGPSTWAPKFSAVATASGASISDVPAADAAVANVSTWAGQPTMSQGSSTAAQKATGSEFPSLISLSTWDITFSALAADAAASTSAAPDRGRNTLASVKAASSHKLNMKLASADLRAAKSSTIQDELSLLEQNQMTSSSVAVELRKLRVEAARSSRSARLKIADPLHAKADTASAGLWHSDQSSARALAQQQEDAGMLLQNGYNSHKKSGHRHRDKSTLGSQRWSR
jgi:hypothetical protein